nr:rubrerythrin family protein [Armatimonas sp.]
MASKEPHIPLPLPLSGASETRSNLEKAYVSETQTSAKYNAYAAVAQREKKPGVAHLFAAASQAEAIHASNHLAVLKQLGVNQPRAGSFPGAAGPSVQNLQDAWQSEAFEVAVAYPVMVAVARQENQSYALHSFRYALATELLHEVLFQAALVRLVKGYPDAGALVYFVCYKCGATFERSTPSTRCPICKVGTFARLT